MRRGKNRNFLAALLTLCMALALLPSTAWAADGEMMTSNGHTTTLYYPATRDYTTHLFSDGNTFDLTAGVPTSIEDTAILNDSTLVGVKLYPANTIYLDNIKIGDESIVRLSDLHLTTYTDGTYSVKTGYDYSKYIGYPCIGFTLTGLKAGTTTITYNTIVNYGAVPMYNIYGNIEKYTLTEDQYALRTVTLSINVTGTAPAETKTVSFSDENLPKTMTSVTFTDGKKTVETTDETITPDAPTSWSSSWEYQFAGWKDEAGNIYQPGQPITVTDGMTLTPTWKLYTINGDKKWNIDDVLTLLSHVSKPTAYQLTDEQLATIDKTADDQLTMVDVRGLMQQISSGSKS